MFLKVGSHGAPENNDILGDAALLVRAHDTLAMTGAQGWVGLFNNDGKFPKFEKNPSLNM